MTVLGAAFAYFAIVFSAGFIAGAIRLLIISPRLGELVAVALELPVMLVLSWWACGMVLRRWPVAERVSARLAMGVTALLLLLAGEAALSILLGGLTLARHVALYATAPVQLGFIGQLIFAAFPLLRMRT